MKAGDMTLRPARIEDARFVADLQTAVRPDSPHDPDQVEHWWRNPDSAEKVERFIAELGGEPVGFAQQRHDLWKTPERYGSVSAEVLPGQRTAARLDAILAAMEERSRGDGTQIYTSWTWEDDALNVGILTKRGYREERRQRFWELDLVANRTALEATALRTRAKMRASGIQVLTIDRDTDPQKFEKVWRMSEEAGKDVPTTVPYVEHSFEDFMTWMRSPGVLHDRIWIGREGDTILGISLLNYPQRGVVSTDWTGVARAGRGRGIARALKYETVVQAIALGVDKVRTDNDSANAPILHINETMGYRRLPDMIQFMRAA